MDKIFKKFIKQYINALNNDIDIQLLLKSADLIQQTRDKGGKIILAGNGGSAAMASHVAVDFTKNASIRAINFNEADLITCFANDYGYENWVEQALKFYADENDLVILISSSGNSENIIRAAQYAKEQNATIVGFSGMKSNNRLRSFCDFDFWVDNMSYNIIENIHSIWLTIICDLIIGSREYSVE